MSLDQIIAWQLGRAFPGRTFIADNRADLGLTLELAIGRLSGLERRPDLLIVYSGHNEFQSRFGSAGSFDEAREEYIGRVSWTRFRSGAQHRSRMRVARSDAATAAWSLTRLGCWPSPARTAFSMTICSAMHIIPA
jgi:hypothetical protein